MSLLEVERDGQALGVSGAGSVTLERLPQSAARDLTLGVRADALALRRGASGEGFSASVIYTEYLGDNAYVYARLGDGTQISVRTSPEEYYDPDEQVTVALRPEAAHFFDREDGRRLAV